MSKNKRFIKEKPGEKLFKIMRGRIFGIVFLNISIFLSMQASNYLKDIPVVLNSISITEEEIQHLWFSEIKHLRYTIKFHHNLRL